MARRPTAIPAILLLLLLLVAMGEMMGTTRVADARTCATRSLKFKGLCLSDSNCANICRTEGFNSGDCRGFRLRCFCTKPC